MSVNEDMQRQIAEQRRTHRELRDRVAEDVERLEEVVAPRVAMDLRAAESVPWDAGTISHDDAYAALSMSYLHALVSAEALKSATESGARVDAACRGALRQLCRVRLALTVREVALSAEQGAREAHLRSLCLRVADAIANHYANEGFVADIRQAGQEGNWALCRAELVLLGADDLHLLPGTLREEVFAELPIMRPFYEKWVAEATDSRSDEEGD